MDVLQGIVDNSNEPMFILNEDGIVTHANTEAMSLLRSYNLEPGKPSNFSLKPHEPTMVTIISDEKVPSTLALCHFETIYDGKRVKFVVIKQVKNIPCDLPQYVIQNTQDMKAVQSQFCAAASHELRTPLSTIRESVALVHDGIVGQITEKQKEVLEIAIRNCDRMKDLITKMLDMAHINAGMYELNRVEVNIVNLITDCFEEWLPRCNRANRQLLLELPDELPTVRCDPDSIRTVLNNLIDNACKYTNPGGIIKLRAKETEAFVSVSVEDNGIGIPESYHRAIFDPFVQVKDERSPATSSFGVGLGLSIVQNLVKLNRGIVMVSSTPGKGSTFTFTLPVFRAARLYKILIVDDNIENLRWMEYSLRMVNENLEVRTTSSGIDALLLAGKILPDLIILDVHLPEIDGHNIVSSIRKKQKDITKSPKILLISADADALKRGDLEAVDDLLPKPFSTEQLVLKVEKLLGIGGHDDGKKTNNTAG